MNRYQKYLQSDEWQAVRARILKRARGKCEKCGKRPPIQVHHKTYARLGRERDEDLLAVCGPCHQAEHPDKKFWEPVPCFIGAHDCPMCPSELALVFAGDCQVCTICTGCGEMEVRLKEGRLRQLRNRSRRRMGEVVPTPQEERAAKNARRRAHKLRRKDAKRRRLDKAAERARALASLEQKREQEAIERGRQKLAEKRAGKKVNKQKRSVWAFST